MPYRKFKHLGVACLSCLALALAAGPAPASAAGSALAHLRVVGGPTLADQDQVSGDVTIKTDPGADCFGPPGGSGQSAAVPGPSALGIVKAASDNNGALRPLSVTDQFGFGLGVCGIGGYTFDQGS